MLLYCEVHTSSNAKGMAVLPLLLSFLQLQLPSGNYGLRGLCVVDALTAVRKVQLEGLFPFGVAMAMLVCVAAGTAVTSAAQRFGKRKGHLGDWSRVGLLATESHTNQLTVESDEHYVDDPLSMSTRSRLVAAVIVLCLFAYSVFLSVILRLVHCIQLPGESSARRVLYVQGSVACSYSGWQAGYVLALALAVAVPVALPLFATWAMQRAGFEQSSWSCDVHIGFKRALVRAYTPQRYWWEAILLLHRLLLALTYTFGDDKPAVQTAIGAIVNALFLALHIHLRPMRDMAAQYLQTVLLFCVCVVALSQMFAASQLQLASAGAVQRSVEEFEVLELLFGYVVPITAVLVSTVGVWCWRRTRQ